MFSIFLLHLDAGLVETVIAPGGTDGDLGVECLGEILGLGVGLGVEIMGLGVGLDVEIVGLVMKSLHDSVQRDTKPNITGERDQPNQNVRMAEVRTNPKSVEWRPQR